jgi:uncharacterized protein (TIGR01244 family)
MEHVKKINNELTVSIQITPEQLQKAAREGFKSILNLRSSDEDGFWDEERQQAEALGLHYVNIPVRGAILTEKLTTEILKQIDDLPKPTLIHCSEGMRSGAMALMNLAIHQGFEMNLEQAFELAKIIDLDCSAYPPMKELVLHTL